MNSLDDIFFSVWYEYKTVKSKLRMVSLSCDACQTCSWGLLGLMAVSMLWSFSNTIRSSCHWPQCARVSSSCSARQHGTELGCVVQSVCSQNHSFKRQWNIAVCSAGAHADYGKRQTPVSVRISLPSAASGETWHEIKCKDVVHPPLLINILTSCLYLSWRCFRKELLQLCTETDLI